MKKLLINILLLSFLELLFRIIVLDLFSFRIIITNLIYIVFIAGFITLITSLFKDKVNKIINYIIYVIICLFFCFEFVLNNCMKAFFSLSLFKLSDQAVGFIGKTFEIICDNLYGIILFFLPLIFIIIFRKKLFNNSNKVNKMIILIIMLVSFGCYKIVLTFDRGKNLSLYDLTYNVSNTSLSIEKLGVIPTCLIDFKRSIFGFEEKVVTKEVLNNKENYNNLNINFDKNIDKDLKNLIESNPGTKKNEYTGLFKNKNLIYITAESFSPLAVSKELTPTLYKLSNNGFVFNNFYSSYYLSTIGGEFQVLTSLYPDNTTLDIWKTGNNSFPYGISNSFKQSGYNTYSYHNHNGHFQNRNKYLKSIGFDNYKACNMGLNIDCSIWPKSDIEMIEESYKDYVNNGPFLAYYMTVSGHMNYDFKNNAIAIKNKKYVDDLDYDDNIKAYISSQIELDRALELLIKRLEENNVLDDTVIVLCPDHYPYALSLNDMNELSDTNIDKLFEINHSSLIVWNSNMDRIDIDKVGMSIDVLPTMYNLFGIDYDSRIYAGNDLLSDTEGLVILSNRSWITDKGRYNSITDTYSSDIDDYYVNDINNLVNNKIIFSKKILDTDGYKYIKIKE